MKKIIFFAVIALAIGSFFLFNTNQVNAVKPADYGLKEGDLISAIFSDDPDVYIVNDSGYKRLFLNPEIFKFYGHLGGFANIKLVTPEIRDSFPTSGFFRNCEDNDQKVFGTSVEGEDNGQLHWINKSGDQAVQEDADFFKKVFCINRKEFNWYPRGVEFKALKEVPQYNRSVEAENPVICHYPVDSPKNFQTIRVAPEALDAHFQHGDTKGACLTPETVKVCPPRPACLDATPRCLPPEPIGGWCPTQTPVPTPTWVPTPTPVPTPITSTSITVVYPNGGEVLQKGTTQIIKWNSIGISKIYIKLGKGNDTYHGPEGMITDVIANVDGYYKWTIPMTLPDGNDYYIRVVDGNYTGGYDDTDSPFSIVASVTQTPVPTITPIPSVSTSPTPIPTPTPTPAPNNPGTLSISGRFINTFTKLPLTNVAISTDAGNIYSNANGEFSFSTTTTDVTTAHSKGIPFYTNCYLQLGHVAAIFRNSDNSLYLKSFLFDLVNGDRTINPLTTNNVALGDVPLWPSKTITVNSDIPVQLYIGYPEEGRSVGNSLYKTQQILSNVVPLEYNTTVRLTDGTGNVYYSPVHRYSLQDGCSQAVLNFSGGQFAWDSAVLTPTPTPTPTPISCAPITVSVSPATPQLQNASPGQNGVSLVIFNVATNCNINLNSFAVSLLPMPNGYQNISSLRLYNNATGTQLGSTVTASVAGLNFTGLNQSISSNQTLSLKVVGDISPSAIVGSTVYGVFGGSSATDATTGTFVGNNASGNLIAGNVITIVAPITRINQSNNLAIFSRNLTVGSTGSDVKQLQALLINEVGYSADLITGYFGRITRDAVKKLQEKYGIKPVYGYFGEITRRALNALISGR